ncbi:hypothetical protein HFP66_29085 [Bacillus sp. A17A.1]
MDPLLFARWTLFLLETAEKDSSSIEKISKLLQKCSFPEHKEIALLLLTFILDGKLKLKRVRKWGNDTQEAIESRNRVAYQYQHFLCGANLE